MPKSPSKSESKNAIETLIGAAINTRKEIVAEYLACFPNRSKLTVMTYLSDAKNPKYCNFLRLAAEHKETGIMYFKGDEAKVAKNAASLIKAREEADAAKAKAA